MHIPSVLKEILKPKVLFLNRGLRMSGMEWRMLLPGPLWESGAHPPPPTLHLLGLWAAGFGWCLVSCTQLLIPGGLWASWHVRVPGDWSPR